MIVAVLVIAVIWVYLLATGITNVLTDVVAVAGLLAAMFYILTALAMVTFYRRRILAGITDVLTVGILPLSAAAFLTWVLARSLNSCAWAAQKYSVLGVLAAGIVLMLIARIVLRSRFFSLTREAGQVIEAMGKEVDCPV